MTKRSWYLSMSQLQRQYNLGVLSIYPHAILLTNWWEGGRPLLHTVEKTPYRRCRAKTAVWVLEAVSVSSSAIALPVKSDPFWVSLPSLPILLPQMPPPPPWSHHPHLPSYPALSWRCQAILDWLMLVLQPWSSALILNPTESFEPSRLSCRGLWGRFWSCHSPLCPMLVPLLVSQVGGWGSPLLPWAGGGFQEFGMSRDCGQSQLQTKHFTTCLLIRDSC